MANNSFRQDFLSLSREEILLYIKQIQREHISIALIFILYMLMAVLIKWKLFINPVYYFPIVILFSIVIIFLNHSNWNIKTALFILLAYIITQGADIYNAKTHLFQGKVTFGTIFGWRFMEVPLIMGMIWMSIIYALGTLMNYSFRSSQLWLKIIVGSFLLVSLSAFAQSSGMYYEFWHWENNIVPFKNYLIKFALGVLLLPIYFFLIKENKNKVGLAYFIISYLFFGLLGV